MSFLARPANNGGGGNTLSVVDLTDVYDSGDNTASIQYQPNGTLIFTNLAPSSWATPGGAYSEGNLWIRLSGVTGSGGTFTGPTVGSWHQMNVNRTWLLSTTSGTAARDGTISIATDSGGANIIETHSFSLTAEFMG